MPAGGKGEASPSKSPALAVPIPGEVQARSDGGKEQFLGLKTFPCQSSLLQNDSASSIAFKTYKVDVADGGLGT